ncbi:nucleotidyl transferase AbiEii/AbiGii toxin family protein [Spirillospora sp. NPDC052269]
MSRKNPPSPPWPPTAPRDDEPWSEAPPAPAAPTAEALARRCALDHVLAVIAGSEWSENLMLRGSMLLRAWYGDDAREPGDLDFVVVPDTIGFFDMPAEQILSGVEEAAARAPRADAPTGAPVLFDADGAYWENIWEYGEAPGARLVLLYDAGDAGDGHVQVDFAFSEYAAVEPKRTEIPRTDGGPPTTVLAATPELSLAWKLLWLTNDAPPQGKDLYDACLLAERVTLPADLLTEVYEFADESKATPVTEAALRDNLADADLNWDSFRLELPSTTPSPTPFKDRLLAALRPTFATPEDP